MPAPERAYAVWLHERRVGTLLSHGDTTRFVLDPGYAQDPNRVVLGLRFEEDLGAQHRAHMRLPPWFSNLLPEGRLRQWIAQARGVSEAREMQLLAEVGHDLPGAVRVTAESAPVSSATPPAREVVSAGAIAGMAEQIWRFSLAGVGLKFSMLQQGDRFTAPGVGEGGDWIIKLPDSTYSQVPLNEYAMMTLARLTGIEVPEIRRVHRDQLADVPARLWPSGEDWGYAVKRFDRLADGNRVHLEDLAQVRGFYPEDKYRGSFETVASLIHRGRDVDSLVAFTRRLAFNILIGNGDAHLKNWSLRYADPRVPRLSPAYDLVATAVYRPAEDPENLGLRFGRSRRFEAVSLANFASLQRRLGVDGVVDLPGVARDLVARVEAGWPEAAEVLAGERWLMKGIGEGIKCRRALLL